MDAMREFNVNLPIFGEKIPEKYRRENVSEAVVSFKSLRAVNDSGGRAG